MNIQPNDAIVQVHLGTAGMLSYLITSTDKDRFQKQLDALNEFQREESSSRQFISFGIHRDRTIIINTQMIQDVSFRTDVGFALVNAEGYIDNFGVITSDEVKSITRERITALDSGETLLPDLIVLFSGQNVKTSDSFIIDDLTDGDISLTESMINGEKTIPRFVQISDALEDFRYISTDQIVCMELSNRCFKEIDKMKKA